MATDSLQEYYEVLEDAFYKRVLIRTTPIPVQYQDMIIGNETGTETICVLSLHR